MLADTGEMKAAKEAIRIVNIFCFSVKRLYGGCSATPVGSRQTASDVLEAFASISVLLSSSGLIVDGRLLRLVAVIASCCGTSGMIDSILCCKMGRRLEY